MDVWHLDNRYFMLDIINTTINYIGIVGLIEENIDTRRLPLDVI